MRPDSDAAEVGPTVAYGSGLQMFAGAGAARAAGVPLSNGGFAGIARPWHPGVTHVLPLSAPVVCPAQDQSIGPLRSMKRPEPAPGPSVARRTTASVPSVTLWGPLWPLRSVAV